MIYYKPTPHFGAKFFHRYQSIISLSPFDCIAFFVSSVIVTVIVIVIGATSTFKFYVNTWCVGGLILHLIA